MLRYGDRKDCNGVFQGLDAIGEDGDGEQRWNQPEGRKEHSHIFADIQDIER
jgi:hypothetical protein